MFIIYSARRTRTLFLIATALTLAGIAPAGLHAAQAPAAQAPPSPRVS